MKAIGFTEGGGARIGVKQIQSNKGAFFINVPGMAKYTQIIFFVVPTDSEKAMIFGG